MRWLACTALWLVLATPLFAQARLTVLVDLLHVREVAVLMKSEGMMYAEVLDRDMLNGQGGAFWAAQIDQIYALPRMTETVREALADGLSDTDIDAAIAFFETALGQEIVELENASRAALQDDAVEAAAIERCDAPADEDVAHIGAVQTFIAQNDLIERNVAGALNSNYRFYLGLAEGGYSEQSDAEILAEIYAQEPEIRSETESWLCGFLLLAYRPLSLEDVEAYVAFYDTPEGRALNAALFEGYEAMYRDISYALGRAIALNAEGDDI